MIASDEEALVCDFAETYSIYDYHALSVDYAATLAAGLREDSRSAMRLAGMSSSFERLLLAAILDNTGLMLWQHTKDAQNGRNKPKSMLAMLTKQEEEQGDGVLSFDTIEDFKRARKEFFNGD